MRSQILGYAESTESFNVQPTGSWTVTVTSAP